MALRAPLVKPAVHFIVAASARTIGRTGRKIIERIDDSLPLDVCETKGSNAWGVDEPPAERQGQRLGRGRGMASAAGEFIDATGCPGSSGHERIDERRFADARMADEYGHSIAQVVFDLGQISAACHRDCRNVEVPVGRQKLGRVTEVHLCEDQQWVDAGVVGSDEASIDEADARRRVRNRDDDSHLVDIGHDDAFVGVCVIRGSTQFRLAWVNADKSGEGVGPATEIADESNVVPDSHCFSSEFARLHRDDLRRRICCQCAGNSAAVDCDNERIGGIFVRWALLAAWPGRAPSANAHIVFVEFTGAHCTLLPFMRSAHIAANCGIVFAVVAMFSTRVPGTRSPTIAPKVAIR